MKPSQLTPVLILVIGLMVIWIITTPNQIYTQMLPILAVLICPIAMIVMMRGSNHSCHHQKHHDADADDQHRDIKTKS